MAFHEIRFPTDISFGSRGGPRRRTIIVEAGSGYENRNSQWADSRREYNAGYGVKSLDNIHKVIAFFEEMRGRLHGFRWKDRFDYKSVSPGSGVSSLDQVIGTGDGTTATFQLTKKYGSLNSYTRTIKKPVSGTVLVAVAGVTKTIVTHYTVDTTTGVVTFTGGNIPTGGQSVTAGFEFDVPVRFDTDYLEIDLSAFEAGQVPSVPIVELKL